MEFIQLEHNSFQEIMFHSNEVDPSLKGQLFTQYSITGEYPDRSREDWRCEVINNDTQLGYWDWVLHKIESDRNYVEYLIDEHEPVKLI